MHTMLYWVLFAMSSTGILSAQPQQTAPASHEYHLLGKCRTQDLRQAPQHQWFDEGYNAYTPNGEIIGKAARTLSKSDLRELTFTVFFGSWCGDSKREVPRFVKTVHQLETALGYSLEQANEALQFVGVSSQDSAYKRSPSGEERGQDIYRVPTMIISHKGKELGRIVEFPVESLERDLLTIIRREPYHANYRSFPIVSKWLKTGVLADSNASVVGLANALRGTVFYDGELHAFGYVLLARAQVQEALTVFRINAVLHPLSVRCHEALAEAYEKAEKPTQAVVAYKKVLELDSKHPRALEQLVRLKAAL
jgi:tetratricopeptide (TPR) repeat protein